MKLLALLLATVVMVPMAQAQPVFSKLFSPNQIGPGSTTTLVYTIDASASGTQVTDLAFTENLPAGLTVASPAVASTTCSGRSPITLSAVPGAGTISFSGGTVGAGATCTVTANVTSATIGEVVSTSGDLTSSAGNSGTASDDLEVLTTRPGFTKSFAPATVGFQGGSRLTFTIDNSLNTEGLSSLSFTDAFPPNLVIADPANVATTCQNESPSAYPTQITADPGSSQLIFSLFGFNVPGFLALTPGSTCTIGVDVVGNAVGVLDNVTSDLSAGTPSGTRSAGKAGATLTVAAGGLVLVKSFLDSPTPPGSSVEVQYTVRNLTRTGVASNVTFTDDLDAMLPGLSATDVPQNDVCGTGSQLTESSGVLTLSGGTLPAEGICTFSATLLVPPGAAQGSYTSSTSDVAGDVGTRFVTGLPATATLLVAAVPSLTQSFIDNPASPGATVTLRSVLTNTSTTDPASDLAFTERLPFLPIPTSSYLTLPANGFCGAGSTLTVGSVGSPAVESLVVSNASLAAGQSCTFDVVIDLPEATAGGTYTTTTSPVTATIGGESVTGAPATTDLVVIAAPRLTTSFPESLVSPGASTILSFELAYGTEASGTATAVAFTDDLDAALAGLVATDLPVAACGGTLSSADGGSTLDFSGGTLIPGETCTFSVPVTVPATATVGTYTNTTSAVTALIGAATVTSGSASGDLFVSPVRFSKDFSDDPVLPGESVTLAFTIENTDATDTVTDLVFTDNLSGVVSGLTSTSGTLNDVCGSGSSLSGTTFLIFTGGSLAAGESCTFNVTASVPAGAATGTYANITSDLSGTLDGTSGVVAQAATALLVVGDGEPAVPTVTSGAAEGWRMLAAPMAGLTVETLTALNLVSGIAGDPQCAGAVTNLFTGYAGGLVAGSTAGYTEPSGYGDPLVAGRGFFWYFWDNAADAGPCGAGATASSVQPLPLTITAAGTPPEADVTTTFADAERAATDDTFYLAGNPFGEGIDLDGTAAGLSTITASDANGPVAFQNTVQVWDAGAGGYVTKTAQADGGTDGSGGSADADNVSVWQGIWLERSTAARPAYPLTLTYDADYRTGDAGTFVGKRSDTESLRTLRFEISGTVSDQPVYDGAASILFADGATADWDAYDASKLGAFSSPYALVAPVGSDRDGAQVAKAAESRPLDVSGVLSVPIAIFASGAGAFELSWPEMEAIPDEWTLAVTDTQTGDTVDLRAATALAFEAEATADWTERFTLTVTAPFVSTEDDLTDGYAVGRAYPNPSRSAATVTLRVAEAQTVRAEVFNVLGQRVATVFDGAVSPGSAVALTVDAAQLATGRYVVRVVGETFVEARQLTVLR